jgi:hypothetical protein
VVFRLQFDKQTTKSIERNFEVKSGLPQTVKIL